MQLSVCCIDHMNPRPIADVTLLRMGSMRAAALPMDKMRAEAVDEYALVRDAWMQKRQHQIAEKP